MKNIIVFLLTVMIGTNAIMAQNKRVSDDLQRVNNDTVRYMKEYIVAKSDSYSGKTFEQLVNDLPLAIRSYLILMSNRPGVYPGIYIEFYSYAERTLRISQRKDPLILAITWQDPLNKEEIESAGLQTLSGNWTPTTYDFFKNKVIKSVSMVRYNF